jgi:hypothetical protein
MAVGDVDPLKPDQQRIDAIDGRVPANCPGRRQQADGRKQLMDQQAVVPTASHGGGFNQAFVR